MEKEVAIRRVDNGYILYRKIIVGGSDVTTVHPSLADALEAAKLWLEKRG